MLRYGLMACPYFDPVRVHPAPLAYSTMPRPLGDCWMGTCRAGLDPDAEPDMAVLDSLCNFGYARGRCPRFPEDDPGPDAVRFAITRVAASSLELCYVQERDHHPFAHGSLCYSLAAGCFLPSAEGPPLEIVARQAEAYVKSYLRRQPEAY
jgi:hypothetical protein